MVGIIGELYISVESESPITIIFWYDVPSIESSMSLFLNEPILAGAAGKKLSTGGEYFKSFCSSLSVPR